MKNLIFKIVNVCFFILMFLAFTQHIKAQYSDPRFEIQFYELENLSCDMAMVKLRIRFTGDQGSTSGENVYVAGMNIHIHCYPEPNSGNIIRIDPATTKASFHSILKAQSWIDVTNPGSNEEELLLSGDNPNGSCCDGDMVFVENVLYDLCTIYMYVEGTGLLEFEDMVEPTVTFDYHATSSTWVRDEFEIEGTIGDYPLYVNPVSGNYNISGKILRQPNDPNVHCPDGMPLVGVSITLTEQDPDIDLKSVANFEGDWCFPAAYDDSHNISLYGMGIGEKLCGVSTADIVRIQRHILGLQTFDARWKKLAADANNNLYITAADIACMRKAILGDSTNEYCPAFSQSWRYETTDSYEQSHSPELLRETDYVDLVSTTALSDIDFYAYKVGDVDGSCDDCQTIQNNNIEIRSNYDTLTLALGNPQSYGTTGNYKIPVYCKLETDLTLLSISIHDPSSSLIGLSNWFLDFGDIRGDYQISGNGSDLDLMWMIDTVESVEVPEDTLLFYMIAEDSTNNFTLNASPVSLIRNSWYPSTSDSGPVKLIKEIGSFGLKKDGSFVYPNPGRHELVISLKEAGLQQADLIIRNVEGTPVIQIKDIKKDVLWLPAHELKSGMYFISLEDRSNKRVQKWIKF